MKLYLISTQDLHKIIVSEDSGFSECEVLSGTSLSDACEVDALPTDWSTATTKECSKWTFDTTDFDVTAVTEFDLVCDR